MMPINSDKQYVVTAFFDDIFFYRAGCCMVFAGDIFTESCVVMVFFDDILSVCCYGRLPLRVIWGGVSGLRPILFA